MSESERPYNPDLDGARDPEPESGQLAAWVDERLEPYLDGELTAEETRRLEAFVRQDEAAARRLALAGRVRALLSTAERPACPPDVTRAVLHAARVDAMAHPAPGRTAEARKPISRRANRSGTGRTMYWTTYVRPALTAAALVMIVVAAALVGGTPRGGAPVAEGVPGSAGTRGPATASAAASEAASESAGPDAAEATPAEVDRALQEARWALAYVSNVGRRAGASIRQEVFEERVSEPVQRALETGLGTALGGEPSS